MGRCWRSKGDVIFDLFPKKMGTGEDHGRDWVGVLLGICRDGTVHVQWPGSSSPARQGLTGTLTQSFTPYFPEVTTAY